MSAETVTADETNDKAAANSVSAGIVESCFVKTAEALSISGVAPDEDIFKALTMAREIQNEGKPSDLIECLARVLGNDEEHISRAISELSAAAAAQMHPTPPLIPFASKLIAPSSFYESFDSLHKLGRALLVPVLYAEDTDAIATGSINPVAAKIFGEQIHQVVAKRFGIRPFITVVRMDYESWSFLCRKHFEL
jgi:hypothetical protein